MELWMLILSLIGLLLVGGGMIAAGVWSVGKISGSVDQLSAKVGELSVNFTALDDKLDDHSNRLIVLESRNQYGHCPTRPINTNQHNHAED